MAHINIHRDIIERCLEGDRSAYKRLYDLYAKAMYNTAYRFVRDPEDAEDVLQDSFVRAFTKLNSFTGTSTFGAWLKRIVVNNSINHLRQKNKQDQFLEALEIVDDDYEHDEDFSYDVEQLKHAMSFLPKGYNAVLSLYLFEGYDHKEIAEILDISTSTSKSQYNRAKKKLIQLMKKREVNYG